MKITFSATLILEILCATLSPLHIRAATFINCLDDVQYWYESDKKSWNDHETAALQLGGHLASITSDTIRYHIESFPPDNARRNKPKWIGGYINPTNLNQWKWSDQSVFDYTNWDSGKPDRDRENCIEMRGSSYGFRWNDFYCDRTLSGVYMVPGGRCTSTPTSKPTSLPTSKPTSSPTSKPTSSPTSKPTSGPMSSPTSKSTSSLTSKPTSGPTTAFEYQNFTIGILQSSFVNDPIDGFTISLNYEPLGHSIKNLSLSLHYSNCTTPISDQVVALKDNPLLSGERTLLIDTGKFSSSDLVINNDLDKNESVGVLGFCVRAEGFDSITGGTSVSFRQDEIHISYDLSSNSFNVIDNTIIADEIETSENNITSTYEVEAFRCTDDFTRDDTVKVLAQNDIVYICVRPVDVPVHISDFEMYFWQDDENKYEAVSYGENVNPLSQLSTEDKTKRVASRIISRFFNGDANGFVVKGNAYLSFDTSRKRQLRSIQEPGQTAEATYTMKVELEKEVFQKNAEESDINEVVGFVAVGTLVFSIIILTFKKMKIQF